MNKIQYCVILKKGTDRGLKQYFFVNTENMKKILDKPFFGEDINKTKIYLGHISGCKGDEVTFDRGKYDSLKVNAGTEQSANKCLDYLGLPIPFPNVEYK